MTQRPQLSETISLLVQNHCISSKDILGMVLILNPFFMFYLHVWRQKEPGSADLYYANAQWHQDSVRPVDKLQCPGRKLIRLSEDHSELFCDLVESQHLFLLEGVSGGCGCCSHFSAAAGINGLKLPSTFCSKNHVSGFPQVN